MNFEFLWILTRTRDFPNVPFSSLGGMCFHCLIRYDGWFHRHIRSGVDPIRSLRKYCTTDGLKLASRTTGASLQLWCHMFGQNVHNDRKWKGPWFSAQGSRNDFLESRKQTDGAFSGDARRTKWLQVKYSFSILDSQSALSIKPGVEKRVFL